MIFKLFKKSFNTIIENPSITFFFVLFLIVLNFLAYYMTTTINPYFGISLVFASVLLGLAFTSGWFQIIKESCDKEKIKEKNYFSIFLEGIGKNIIPVTLGSIIYFSLLMVIIFLTSLIASALFGDLNSIIKDILAVAQTSNNAAEFLNNLSDNQKYILFTWQLSFIIANAIYAFVLMYYFPSVLEDNNKNVFIKPFYAFYGSICFLFKNFLNSFLIFILISSVYVLSAILRNYIAHNSILMVLLLFFYIYFISSAIMLIFNYYYEQKNLCNNGTDCIGENNSCDSSCKED